jgi:glutamyl-tRNA reductase
VELVCAGLSYRTAPVAVRERAAVSEAEARTVLRYLVGHSGLSAAALLSTCNRTEFYLTSPGPELSGEVVPRLARYLDPAGTGGVGEHLRALRGRDAVHHVFRVAGGLDSMVVGEAQILSQFKAAHRLARDAGTLDPHLDFVMRRATSVAKRVRTETGLGHRSGSVSSIAVEYARTVLGELADVGVLLVGAGEMSALAARRLAAEKARVYVTSRGGVSAIALATELRGTPVAIDDMKEIAGDLDLLICSTSDPHPVLRLADVHRVQQWRGHRPLCILDIAVPRDVEPEAGMVEGVTLVDLDVLGETLARNLEGRRSEVPAAERIIELELEPTMSIISERDGAGPTIKALTHWAEELRRQELERGIARLGEIDPRAREQLDTLTRSLVRKLLHPAIAHLKENADDPRVALFLRESFELDGGVPPGEGASQSPPG